jgi:hypothetical protein
VAVSLVDASLDLVPNVVPDFLQVVVVRGVHDRGHLGSHRV